MLQHAVELLQEVYNDIWKKEMSEDVDDAVSYVLDKIQDSYGSGELCVLLHEYQTDLYLLLENGYELPAPDNKQELDVWVQKTEDFLKEIARKKIYI